MTDEERRAADQDAAIEQAFIDGTLPEEDRRAYEIKRDAKAAAEAAARVTAEAVATEPSEVSGEVSSEMSAEVDPSVAVIAAAGVGSVFEKTAIGWNVKYVDGGTVIFVQGATIADAVAGHGTQIEHPKTRERLAREAATAAVIQ